MPKKYISVLPEETRLLAIISSHTYSIKKYEKENKQNLKKIANSQQTIKEAKAKLKELRKWL